MKNIPSKVAWFLSFGYNSLVPELAEEPQEERKRYEMVFPLSFIQTYVFLSIQIIFFRASPWFRFKSSCHLLCNCWNITSLFQIHSKATFHSFY